MTLNIKEDERYKNRRAGQNNKILNSAHIRNGVKLRFSIHSTEGKTATPELWFVTRLHGFLRYHVSKLSCTFQILNVLASRWLCMSFMRQATCKTILSSTPLNYIPFNTYMFSSLYPFIVNHCNRIFFNIFFFLFSTTTTSIASLVFAYIIFSSSHWIPRVCSITGSKLI